MKFWIISQLIQKTGFTTLMYKSEYSIRISYSYHSRFNSLDSSFKDAEFKSI